MKKRNNFSSFSEYLTNRGKVLEKPPTEALPDYKGPHKKKPDAAKTKGKNWEVGGGKSAGGGGNYATTAKSRPAHKPEGGGFGHMGDKKMVYQPTGKGGKKTKSEEWLAKGDKKLIYNPVSTEAFLAQTKGMNTAQFAKHIKKGLTEHAVDKKAPHVTAYAVGAFHPDPIQAIKYVTYLAGENAHLCRALVREAKRYGCVNKLLGEMLSMPETFEALAGIIESKHGEVFTRRLERAVLESRAGHKRKSLTEDVDKPAHHDDEDDEHVDDENKDKSEDDELNLGDGDDKHKDDGDEDHDDEHKEDDGDEDHDDDSHGGELDLGDGEDGDTPAAPGGKDSGDMNLDDDDNPPPPPDDHDDNGDDGHGDDDNGDDDNGDDGHGDDGHGDDGHGDDGHGDDGHGDDGHGDDGHGDDDEDGDDDQLKFGDEDSDEDENHLDLDDDDDKDDDDDNDDDDEDHLDLGDDDEDRPHPHRKQKMPWE